MLTLIGYVLKNLGRQKLRTALASLGVMLGVWLVVVFSAVSDGALVTVESMLSQFGEDFHCYEAGAADQFLSRLPDEETRVRLRSVPGVRDTSSVLVWLARTKKTPFLYMMGLRPGEFALQGLMQGGVGGFGEGGAEEVLVGRGLADREELSPGDEIEIGGRPFVVAGIFKTGATLFDNAAVVPIDRMQTHFMRGSDVATYVAVRVEDGARPREVAALVEERFPDDLSSVRTLDELAKVDQGLEKLEMWSLVITVVATVLGWLFVMLAMVMAVFERTREVGILRAVGWSRGRIVLVVLLEALLLAGVGVVVGIPTGFAGVELIASLTDLGNYLKPAYEPALYLKTMLVALLAATIGGIYPAWRAARLRPVEAIRHE